MTGKRLGGQTRSDEGHGLQTPEAALNRKVLALIDIFEAVPDLKICLNGSFSRRVVRCFHEWGTTGSVPDVGRSSSELRTSGRRLFDLQLLISHCFLPSPLHIADMFGITGPGGAALTLSDS